MRKVSLFIASSLDGFIARADGSVDWLFTDQDYGYGEFYDGVETLLMGRKTYDQCLSFGDYPYPGKRAYVFSSRPLSWSNDDIEAVSGDAAEFIADLRRQEGGTVWLVGGSALISTCLKHNLIDEFVVSVHPIILGHGIPLFSGSDLSHRLKLESTRAFDTGLVQLRYRSN